MTHRGSPLFLALAIGCGAAAADDDGSADSPDAGAPPIEEEFPDIEAIHARSIAPTCSPNGGVCHNSREYPDLHTVSNLVAQVGQPCNVAAQTPAEVSDRCEPEGDHLVVPSLGIDVEIAYVTHSPVEAETELLGEVVVTLAGPHGAGQGGMAAGFEVRRGSVAFELSAPLAVVDANRIRIDVRDTTTYQGPLRVFLDDRIYPWQPHMIRAGDPNRNGTMGGASRIPVISPGSPDDSYMVMRLIDEEEGDLMPRQCRVWNQLATRALGCWVAGLTLDDDGQVANAFDPIDYSSCRFDPGEAGRCADNDKQVVAEIFGRTCGGSGCHIDEDEPAQDLDLGADPVRDELVGVPSAEAPEWARVEPGRPDRSYLYCKLIPECADRVGARMPAGGPPLSAADLEAIRRWIAAGAR